MGPLSLLANSFERVVAKPLLGRQARVDLLRNVPRPNVAVKICDASSTLGCGYVAVQNGRIVDDPDRTRRTRDNLCPHEPPTSVPWLLIIQNGIVKGSIENYEPTQESGDGAGMPFRTSGTVRVGAVASEDVIVRGAIGRQGPGSRERIGHQVSNEIARAGNVAAERVV